MGLRSCGDCTECCNLLEIPTLNKESKTECPNVCSSGCSIYSSRPQECSTFECGWLQGGTGPGQRPDKSGIMAYNILHPELGETLLVIEIKERAFIKRSGTKDKWIKFASKKKTSVILYNFDGTAEAMVS